MTNAEPKNGFLVVTLKTNGPEELVITTQDGPIVIQIRAMEGFNDRARVAVNAPRSVPINRRKIQA